MNDLAVPIRGFERWELHIRSFVALDEQAIAGHGPLKNFTVGVKDIIDVAGLPTRNGSQTCANATPATADARVVSALRAAGARIVGKTVTTEFAFTDPTECRNPHDLNRSPGGSSSGSGAAVAAGLVDLALGTQTAGSLCRPAAYCGVVGFKPSYGVLPTEGVTPLAPSFDTVGIIARSVSQLRVAFQAMSGQDDTEIQELPKVGCALFENRAIATQDVLNALEDARVALGHSGISVSDVSLRCDLDTIVSAHRTVMLAEAAQAHGNLLQSRLANLLQPKFRAALEKGADLSGAQVSEARQLLAQAKTDFWKHLAGVDAILTLPVPEGAPLLDGTTGFQDWLTPWTVFEGPLFSIPWGLDSLGRPRAVMLAGPPGTDLRLMGLAAQLEAFAPVIVEPQPPQR